MLKTCLMVTKHGRLHAYHEHYVDNTAEQTQAKNIFVRKKCSEKFPIKTRQLPAINCNSPSEEKT